MYLVACILVMGASFAVATAAQRQADRAHWAVPTAWHAIAPDTASRWEVASAVAMAPAVAVAAGMVAGMMAWPVVHQRPCGGREGHRKGVGGTPTPYPYRTGRAGPPGPPITRSRGREIEG